MSRYKLKETVFDLHENWKFACSLIPRLHHKDRDRFAFVHAVYFEGPQILPIFSYCLKDAPGCHEVGDNDLFSKCLSHYKPKQFYEFLFFIDVYKECCLNQELDMREIYEQKNRLPERAEFDFIVPEADGAIIWNYQLDNAIRLFNTELLKIKDFYESLDMVDVVSGFRRGLLSGKMLFIELTARLMVTKSYSLYDVLTEKMLLERTLDPNIEGAHNLMCLSK